jgi:protease YdgD
MRTTALALALALGMHGAPGHGDGLRALTLRQDILGWEGVGRLELGRDGYCTGVLVAPDLVLTAAHCLFDGETPRRPEDLVFRAGDRSDDTIAARGVVQAAVDHGYLSARAETPDRIAADVALLKLETAIPAGTARPFLIDPAPPGGGQVSVLSYGAGRDAVPSREAGCRLLGRQAGILAFDCDVTFGSSGAPVFRLVGDRIRIVSIVSSGHRGDRGSLAFGPVLDGKVAALTAALRSGRGLWEVTPPAARRLVTEDGRAAGGARFLRP